MPLFDGPPEDVLVAMGDKAAVLTSPSSLSSLGVSAAVAEAQGLFSLSSVALPTVRAGEVFDHSAGETFEVIGVVDGVDGQVVTETVVVDVAGNLLPVTTGELASDTAQSTEEIAEVFPVDETVDVSYFSDESGVSLTNDDVAQGEAASPIPIGFVTSDVRWDEGAQMFVDVILIWDGEKFVELT